MGKSKRTYRKAVDARTKEEVRLRKGDLAVIPGEDKHHAVTYLGNGKIGHQTFDGYREETIGKHVPLVRVHRASDEDIPTIVGRSGAQAARNRPYSYLTNTCEDAAFRNVFGEAVSPTRRQIVGRVGLGVGIAAAVFGVFRVFFGKRRKPRPSVQVQRALPAASQLAEGISAPGQLDNQSTQPA